MEFNRARHAAGRGRCRCVSLPSLPVEAIRAAMARGDYDGAHALLVEHESHLRSALDDGSFAAQGSRQAWLDLVEAQRLLIEERRGARDEAGRALDRLGRDRRGMSAYLEAPE